MPREVPPRSVWLCVVQNGIRHELLLTGMKIGDVKKFLDIYDSKATVFIKLK